MVGGIKHKFCGSVEPLSRDWYLMWEVECALPFVLRLDDIVDLVKENFAGWKLQQIRIEPGHIKVYVGHVVYGYELELDEYKDDLQRWFDEFVVGWGSKSTKVEFIVIDRTSEGGK